jgi:hypothetical protein
MKVRNDNAFLTKDLHSTKRSAEDKIGLHSWHQFYAGYSEQFVRDILTALAEPNTIILDIWNGSGTTTLAAQQAGLRSIGIELNPVMAIHAGAKTCLSVPKKSLLRECERILSKAKTARQMIELPQKDNLVYQFVPANALKGLIGLLDIVKQIPAETTHPLSILLKKDSLPRAYCDAVRSFFFSAIFQCLRRVGTFHYGSNPTWPVANGNSLTVNHNSIYESFRTVVNRMLDQVSTVAEPIDRESQALVLRGDARSLPLRNSSVDLIITSPPYCTRIDYIISTMPELALLGYSKDSIRDLRKLTMGAPVIARRAELRKSDIGLTCSRFLTAVERHTSKASKSYYLPIFVQYFSDALLAVGQMRRVLKKNGEGVVVVQSSYYKDVELDLGAVYVEMARKIGLRAKVLRRQPVRQHMAHLNKNSSKYLQDRTYYEDILLFKKP